MWGREMKLMQALPLVLACSSTFAQESPSAPAPAEYAVRKSTPKQAQSHSDHDQQPTDGSGAVSELLRAQTAAILELSSRIDSLESRIAQIEKAKR